MQEEKLKKTKKVVDTEYSPGVECAHKQERDMDEAAFKTTRREYAIYALLIIGVLSIVFSLTLLLAVAGFVVSQLAGIDHAVLTDPTATDTARLEFLPPYLLSPQAMILWLVVMIAAVLYSMATFFAVPLIVLRDHAFSAALKASFAAVSANWLPFLLYALIWLVLFMSVPLTLMLSLIVLVPLLLASMFAAFESIWPDEPTRPADSFAPKRVSTVM